MKPLQGVERAAPILLSIAENNRHLLDMQRRALMGLLVTAVGGWSGPVAAATSTQHLFTIARSKNANVVHYVARVAEGGLVPSAPIHAYWLMLAEDGRREPLSWAERKLAYGFEPSHVSARGCQLSLVAFRERTIQVERSGAGFRAIARIAGRRAVLQRLFVQADEGGMLPSVRHVDVSGTSLDGRPLSERITPA